jgi:thioredoxin-related protein
MKRFLSAALIILMMCSFAHAEKLKWYSWNEGYELSKKENKPMIIFVQASWCNTCKRLDEKTFNNEEVMPLLTQKFIPVKFDVEAKEEYTLGESKVGPGNLLKALSIDPSKGLAVPTTVFWMADSKKAKPVAGLKDPREMMKLLRKKYK